MKGLSRFIVILLICFGANLNANQDYTSEYRILNGELPWPFGSEIPFPWEDIDGLWVGEEVDGDAITFFSLRVRGQTRDERTLEVLEVYLDQCTRSIEILAQGRGIESQRVVRGQMVSSDKRGGYRFSIRAYDVDRNGVKADSKDPKITRVLTVAPVDPRDPKSVSFELTRISERAIIPGNDGECPFEK